MAKFSGGEASASNIVRMEKKYQGGTFVGWIFGTTDGDGNYDSWVDASTSESATKTQIKVAVRTHLRTNVDKRAAVVRPTFTSVDDKGLGETVG